MHIVVWIGNPFKMCCFIMLGTVESGTSAIPDFISYFIVVFYLIFREPL